MTVIRLHKSYHCDWQTDSNISASGSAFHDETLLNTSGIISYFKSIKNENEFLEKVNNLSGHFSVIIELESQLLAAVDLIRTFPLFYKQENKGFVISNQTENDGLYDAIEIEHFKKMYCTLENNTLLQNWKQIQAGEYIVIDKSESKCTVKTYFHHFSEKEIVVNSEDLKKKETKLIRQAIHYANNRTILIPLSGGYDSRYLLCLLLEHHYVNILCYTYGKKESYEVKTAEKIAQTLNIKWIFIEYTDELLSTFFTEKWKAYSATNHHFTSLPHEQDFFALHYLKENKLLPENVVVMNGFCQDIHAGSFITKESKFDLSEIILQKHQLHIHPVGYQNNWNSYQEWLIKNRISKFIVNSVHVYSFYNLDFYLPFWQKEWIQFWYSLPFEERVFEKYYINYLFKGIFKKYNVRLEKPDFDQNKNSKRWKTLVKTILPERAVNSIKNSKIKNIKSDSNNTFFLYDTIFKFLKEKSAKKDYKINSIHAAYFLEGLFSDSEKKQL